MSFKREGSKQSKPAERQAAAKPRPAAAAERSGSNQAREVTPEAEMAAKPTALPAGVLMLCKKHGVARPLAWAIRDDGTAVVIAEDGRKFVG